MARLTPSREALQGRGPGFPRAWHLVVAAGPSLGHRRAERPPAHRAFVSRPTKGDGGMEATSDDSSSKL